MSKTGFYVLLLILGICGAYLELAPARPAQVSASNFSATELATNRELSSAFERITRIAQPAPRPLSLGERLASLPPRRALELALDLLPGEHLDTLDERREVVLFLRSHEKLAPEQVHEALAEEMSPSRLAEISGDPRWVYSYLDLLTRAYAETSTDGRSALHNLVDYIRSDPDPEHGRAVQIAYSDVFPEYREAMRSALLRR